MNKRLSASSCLQQWLALTGVLLCFALIPSDSQGQTPVPENFDASAALPLGWTQNVITNTGSAGNDFTVVTAGTTPASTPFSPTRMIKYDSYAANTGDAAFLATVPYDFTLRGAAVPTVNFRMYRSTTAGSDRMEVYVNTSPDLSGTPTLLGSVFQNSATPGTNSGAPGGNLWDNITFNVTNATYNGAFNYIIFRGQTGGTPNTGGNIFIDNLLVNTYPTSMTYTVSNAIQNQFPLAQGATNEVILQLEVLVTGAANPCNVTTLRLNTNGTTNTAEITNAKIYYTGASDVFQAINQFGATINAPIATSLNFTTGTQTLVNGYNYFWLTYSVSGTAVTGNLFDADWIDLDLIGGCAGTRNPLVASPAGERFIDFAYCLPSYSYGTGTTRYIDDVEVRGAPGVGSLVNNNSCRTTTAPFYKFYPPGPGKTTTLIQGSVDSIRVRVGQRTPFGASTSYSNSGHVMNAIAWIDFNRNGTFEGWERIFEAYYANGIKYLQNGKSPTYVTPPATCSWSSLNPNGTIQAAFVVPNLGVSAAYLGSTRMRVRFVRYSFSTQNSPVPGNPLNPALYANSPPNTAGATSGAFTSQHSPCGVYSGWVAYGETEDYVVTISPPCGPGEWLGFTDDWNTASNWCDGIPTNITNVVIPTVPIGGKMPIVHDGDTARCNNITIAAGATLTLKLPKTGYFRAYGTITNNGTIKSDTLYRKPIIIGSGKLYNELAYLTPYSKSVFDGRVQMLYFASELSSRGLKAGDAIDTLGFQVIGKYNGFGFADYYNNFTVNIGHTIAANAGSYGPPNSTGNNFMTFSGAPVTSGATNITPVCPTGSGFGCNIIAAGGYTGASQANLYQLTNSFIWDGVSNVLVETCFDNDANLFEYTEGYPVYCTQTTGITTLKSVISEDFGTYTAGCTLPGNVSSGSVYGNVLDIRPNLIVQAYSPLGITPIYVNGNWINNGTFSAGRSNVIFEGTTATQSLGGTSITNFSRLTLNKPNTSGSNGVVVLANHANVDTTLVLANGILELSQYRLTLNNATQSNTSATSMANLFSLTTPPAGWARLTTTPASSGFVRGSSLPPSALGFIQWNIGTASAAAGNIRTFPYGSGAPGTSTGTFIPVGVEYTNASTTLGNVSVATYATPPNNQTFPPAVSHINNTSGTDDSANMVDRYWIVDKSGASTNTFGLYLRWPSTEDAGTPPGGTGYKAQRWNTNVNTGWQLQTGTPNAAINPREMYISGANISALAPLPSGWVSRNIWAITGNGPNQPLPVNLLAFEAILRGEKVHLSWITNTEKDNDFFTVEKTKDGQEFLFVNKVPGAGNSSTVNHYNSVDDKPLHGLSYYRLTQTDFDGKSTQSPMVPVTYKVKGFEIVSVAIDGNEAVITFVYDSDLPYNVSLNDGLGRQISGVTNRKAEANLNVIRIPAANIGRGVYYLNFWNNAERATRKLVF